MLPLIHESSTTLRITYHDKGRKPHSYVTESEIDSWTGSPAKLLTLI